MTKLNTLKLIQLLKPIQTLLSLDAEALALVETDWLKLNDAEADSLVETDWLRL